MDLISIYCDEDVHGAVPRALQRRGVDVASTTHERNLGFSDIAQLEFAMSKQRTLLTCNVDDFPRIHYETIANGIHHYGIIVARQDLSIGEIVRRIMHLTALLSREDMEDRLEYLSSW